MDGGFTVRKAVPALRINEWRKAVADGKTTLGLEEFTQADKRRFIVGSTLIPVFFYVDTITGEMDSIHVDTEFIPSHYERNESHFQLEVADREYLLSPAPLPEGAAEMFGTAYNDPNNWPEWVFGW